MRTVFLLTVVAAAMPGMASPAQEPMPTFSERVEVNIVNVDIEVYDRKGRPGSGLRPADFELIVDDEPVAITNFYEDSPGILSAVGPAALVVYVDDTHTTAADRDNVLASLEPFIMDRLETEESEVMLVRYDGQLGLVRGFTDDTDALGAAFDALSAAEPVISESQALERSTRADMTQTLELLRGGPEERRAARTFLNSLLKSARNYGAAVARDTRSSAIALESVVRALATRQGRKELYFVGDGMVLSPLEQFVQEFQQQMTELESGQLSTGDNDASRGQRMNSAAGDEDEASPGEITATRGATLPSSESLVIGQDNTTSISRLHQELSRMTSNADIRRVAAFASSSRVAIHSIRPPNVDASSASLGNRASDTHISLSNRREAPLLMSEITGGHAMVAGVNVGSFLEKTKTTGARYSLGFAATEEAGFHSVEVKGRKGHRVRFPESFVSRTQVQRFVDRTAAALELGWEDNPHRAVLELASSRRTAEGDYAVSFNLAMPMTAIRLLDAGAYLTASCHATIITSTDGEMDRTPLYLQIPVNLTPEQIHDAEHREVAVTLEVRVPEGRSRVAVGLLEEATDRRTFLSREFSAGGEG